MQWKAKRGSAQIKRAPMVREVFATGLSVEHHGDYVRITFVSETAPIASIVPFANEQVVATVLIPFSEYRACVRAMLDAPPMMPQ